MIDTMRNTIDNWRGMRVRQMSRYWQATADIPSTLYPYWKRTAQFEFKGIPQDAFFFARATEGLLTFFDCVRTSGKPCALPSAAADSVWHAWARLAPASLHAFCMEHFGKAIPHVEAAGMGARMEDALVTCLVSARRLERRSPVKPSVPRLFALDRNLRMPGGFGYQLEQGEVACRRLGHQGRPEGEMFYPAGLIAAQFLAAGIPQPFFDRPAKRSNGDGGVCGTGVSGSCGSCDGGSGCGSGGCGGGCGGS
jgi:hypothetical protein